MRLRTAAALERRAAEAATLISSAVVMTATLATRLRLLVSVALLALAPAACLPPPEASRPAPRTEEYPWMSMATWKAKHAEDRERAAQGGVDLLFLGDSITEGWADQPLWDEAFGRFRPANFGIGGDTTQNLLWRLGDLPADKLDPKAVVLLIGTNNFGLADDGPEEVFRGVAAVVGKLRSLFPKARVLLLGIFPVDERPESLRRRAVAAANARIESLDDGEKVLYRDIGGRFLEPDGTLSPRVMPDFLHLSPEGYRRWADTILPVLEAWLE